MGIARISDSSSYTFEQLLSENNLAQAWSATSVITNQKCFVKYPSNKTTLTAEKINSLLSKSFTCQKLLKTTRILKAHRKLFENNQILIEYAYLDPCQWRSLNAELFWQFWPEVLIQIGIITDLIHHQQLVHLDLKLENFQIDLSKDKPFIVLTDLDFLTNSGTTLDAKILGTPEHIAPEILRNDIITAQTDNYSLGQSINLALNFLPKNVSGDRDIPNLQNLKAFVTALTSENPIDRPYSVLDGLYQYQLIDQPGYIRAKKTVVSNILLGNFQRFKELPFPTKKWLAEFLQRECKVFGFHEELTAGLEQVYSQSPLAVVKLFKKIVTDTEIDNFGDFWQFKFNDDFLESIFSKLDKLLGVKRNQVLSNPDNHLKRYIYLLKNKESNFPKTKKRSLPLWRKHTELGDLAQELNRPLDAVTHYREAINVIDSGISLEKVNNIFQLSVQLILTGQQKEAEEILVQGIADARAIKADKEELELQNQLAYLFCTQGKLDEATQILNKIVDRAKRLGMDLAITKAYYNFFCIEYIKGNYSKAEELIEKCLSFGKKAQDDTFLTTIYTGLSILYTDLAEYDKSIRMCNNVIKLTKTQGGKSHKLLSIYSNLVFVYTRLGLSKNSEYWLNLFLSIKNNKFDKLAFLDYSIMKGLIEKNRGQLQSAREILLKASSLFQSIENIRHIGKAHYNMAEITLHQGHFEECDKYSSKALNIFEKLHDQDAYTEISFLRLLNLFYNKPSKQPDQMDFLEVLEKLFKNNCRYYTVNCFLHIAVYFDDETFTRALKIIEPLKKQIYESSAPLFKTVRNLIDYRENILTSGHKIVRYLKDAYQVLENTDQKFFALIICRMIGRYYQDNLQQKLSRKFYLQALLLAQQLHHRNLEKQLSEQIDTFSEKDYIHEQVLKSMLGISSILRDIEKYENALRKVVEFAVNETGAERGVLLLKTEGTDELQTKAYINCDEDSLKDICDFSKSIVTSVAKQASPLVVSDALSDKRTKNYKSIAIHNIRSVIGMPIEEGDNFYGVLYLDHHTIPALFSDDDITYVTSLTNFLAVILNVLRRYKTASVNKEQLEIELFRQGLSEVFVTHNSNLKKMIEQLPQLAQSNASILILGETGTGKEILSRLIHNLSHRAKGPFVKMNCAAIAESLIESELFGIEDKIATDVKAREGKFEAADNGTLFLDEIGDMPLNIQTKVLGVVEYHEFERVGSNRISYTDARFIYATNKDLKKMVDEGKFSKDLFYRIYSLVLEITPLRERPEDIEPLIEHFCKLNNPNPHKNFHFSAAAIKALMAYHWPGNVRELKNLVDSYLIRFPGTQIDLINLPPYIQHSNQSETMTRKQQDTIEKTRITKALNENNWNQLATSKYLKMPLSTLRRKIKKNNITRP